MDGKGCKHLSDEKLAQFRDGALLPLDAEHLGDCSDCRTRLEDMERAEVAFAEYCDHIRGPQLPPVPKPWPRLSVLVARQSSTRTPPAFRRWAVAACAVAACVAVAVIVPSWPSGKVSRETTTLLGRVSG